MYSSRIRIIIGQPESKHDTERYGNGDNRSDRPKPPPRSLCFRHDNLCDRGVSARIAAAIRGEDQSGQIWKKVFRNRRFNFSCASNYSVPLPKIRRRVCKLGGNGQTYGMKFGMKLVSETRERTRWTKWSARRATLRRHIRRQIRRQSAKIPR